MQFWTIKIMKIYKIDGSTPRFVYTLHYVETLQDSQSTAEE